VNVVIGIGNPYRCDDAIGLLVADSVAQHGVNAVQSDGEPAGLMLAWEGADLVVIVDAVVCEPATPGRIHRSATLPSAHGVTSSHGLGIPDAVALATALGRLPGRLVVFAVEAVDVSLGVGLSDAVARALPGLVDQVLGELGVRLK
jgi:hydrogenase maturation protease